MATKTTSSASRAYAQAIIELAGDRADEVGQELAQLAAIIQQNSLFRAFVADPAIGPAQRWVVLRQALNGRSSELLRNTVGILNEKNRLTLLSEIVTAYSEMLDARKNRVRVELTVAHKLDEQELRNVQQRVSSALGKTAVIEQKIDDSIIGGLVLKVHDKVIDGSVKAQLDAMRRQLLTAKA